MVVLASRTVSRDIDTSPAEALNKLRRIIAKIRCSTTLWDALKTEAEAIKLKWLSPILDVRVRWNSTYQMLDRALQLRPAIERLLLLDSSRLFSRAGLTLVVDDWFILEKLRVILGVFNTATKFENQSTYQTLTMQLPYYQYVEKKLRELIQEERHKPGLNDQASTLLWTAADEAYKKLILYWQKTDDHSGQAVATVLDPRMRLQVFTNFKWEEDSILDIEQRFRRIYNNYYATKASGVLTGAEEEVEMVEDPHRSLGQMLVVGTERPNTASSAQPEAGFDFQDLVFGPPESTSRESEASHVDIYLRGECANRNENPVIWWKLNAYRFPLLALMARDYLSVPATRYHTPLDVNCGLSLLLTL